MELLDGKKTAALVQEAIAEEVRQIVAKGHRPPHLVAILVGNNGASMTYVNNKVTACERVGFASSVVNLPEDISQEALLEEIEKLNKDKSIDGFIVQLPLPKHINEQEVLLTVNPDKDADGFHPTNFGRMALG